MVRNYRQGPKWVEGVLTKQIGPLTFLMQVDQGQILKHHVDQLQDIVDSPQSSIDTSPTETTSSMCDDFLYPSPDEDSTNPSTPSEVVLDNTQDCHWFHYRSYRLYL